jgi:hypothetical protein
MADNVIQTINVLTRQASIEFGSAYIDGRTRRCAKPKSQLADWSPPDVTYDVVGVISAPSSGLEDHLRRFRASMTSCPAARAT